MSTRLKEGELLKYRNVLLGWKKYHFRLERSYLHYLETEFVSEPKGTITRGEITQVAFTKDDIQPNFGFEIHLKNGVIWHLRAKTHEERMDWMRTLQPDAYIVDPLKEVPQPSAPTIHQAHPPNRLYPQLPTTSSEWQQDFNPGPPDSPPPAYDEINNR